LTREQRSKDILLALRVIEFDEIRPVRATTLDLSAWYKSHASCCYANCEDISISASHVLGFENNIILEPSPPICAVPISHIKEEH
jgi:hypothetical protein